MHLFPLLLQVCCSSPPTPPLDLCDKDVAVQITPWSLQNRRRSGVDNAPSQHMEMSMLQQVVPRQETYAQSRAVALHSVESTITELGGIFTHLATMVAHQGELAIRSSSFLISFRHLYLLTYFLLLTAKNHWLLSSYFHVVMLSRIDDNMDESLANVESARSALLRHLNRISSNRWLLIKIFAIIILFLMIFVFFVA